MSCARSVFVACKGMTLRFLFKTFCGFRTSVPSSEVVTKRVNIITMPIAPQNFVHVRLGFVQEIAWQSMTSSGAVGPSPSPRRTLGISVWLLLPKGIRSAVDIVDIVSAA